MMNVEVANDSVVTMTGRHSRERTKQPDPTLLSSTPFTGTTPSGKPLFNDSFTNFINDKIWVWVLVAVAVIALVVIFIIIYCIIKTRRRRRRRYNYVLLTEHTEDLPLPHKIHHDQQRQQDARRDAILINCQFYLRGNGLYVYVDQLKDIGSRFNKYWFMVKDKRTKTEKLLSLVPKSSDMLLPFNTATKQTLSELFQTLQHPYIYPINDIDFIIDQDLVVVVTPYNSKGTLKDLIYHSRCLEQWSEKYCIKSKGLPVQQIQAFGRQILEGMLFLDDKGFVNFGHLHSGNVIIENYTCKLTGYENLLLGHNPRLLPRIKRRHRYNGEAVDSICFGHLLFEMASGYELNKQIPEAKQLLSISNDSVREVVNFIFGDDHSFPSIRKISQHTFFCGIVLRELQVLNPAPIHLTVNMKKLLNTVRKGQSRSKSTGRKSTNGNIKLEEETGFSKKRRSSTRTTKASKRRVSSSSLSKAGHINAPVTPPTPPTPPLPPPVAPPPPPLLGVPPISPPGGTASSVSVPAGRGALLSDIRKGMQLKKTDVNDRSNPRV